MAITSFQETDTAAVCGQPNAFCSGQTSAASADARQAILGGAAGTVAHTVTMAASATDVIGVNFEIPAASLAGLVWAAGQWTVRLHITTANLNVSLDSISICQVNNACASVSSIVSTQTGIGDPLNATTHTVQFNGVAVPSPASTDTVQILLAFTNALASSQAFAYKADVLIDSPFGVVPIPTEEPDQFMAFGPIPPPTLVSLWG